AVMHHLDEVSRAGRTTVQIPQFGTAAEFLAARSARNISHARRESTEDGIESIESFFRSADHHAVAALDAPDAAAGPHIEVVNAAILEFWRAAHVVLVI